MKRILFLFVIVSSLLLPVRPRAADGLPEVVGGRADMVVMGGKVLTVDPKFSIQQAFAIRGGRFVAVGSDEQIRLWIGPNTRVINVGGRTVVPGLNDAHMQATALGMHWARDVHWEFTRSLADGLRQISAATVDRPAGSWIVVDGGWSPAQFPERRFPTRAELDAAAPKQPVLVRYGTRAAILNSAGLAAAGIARNTADPAGGKFEHDPGGELTGVIRGFSAVEYANKKIPEPELDTAREGLRAFFSELVRVGITSLTDFQTGNVNFAHRRLLADMARSGEIRLRMSFYVAPTEPGNETKELRRLADEVRPISNENFRFIGFGDRLFAGRDPDADFDAVAIDEKTREKVRNAVQFLAASGSNFQLRARNDAITRQFLDVLEEISREKPFGNRRIGFTGVGDLAQETIDRIKKIGAGISVETGSVLLAQDDNNSGASKNPSVPLRKITAARIPVAAGSDAFHSGSYSPMLSLWSLITGKSVAGAQIRAPEENVTREEALRMYTIGGAWFTADDWRKGSIEVGKLADFAVLSGDYLTVPEERIPTIESMLTVIGGGIVYTAGPFARFAKQ